MRKTISIFLLLTTFFASANTSLIDSKSTLESKVQLLLDREEISQTITNYGLSFDQLDWKLHRSVFTDEIQMDFSASIGDGLSTMQADDWVNGVKGFFHNLNATQHIAAPLTISI
ncbi:nuclear transport factor 2 family protein [Alteromonas sp. P256]|uniref:nuclear transport factor 2 family protein n=1 Tax=Alteromonas sp. P256 TaxID=3117399 RepID=UPI002FE1D930